VYVIDFPTQSDCNLSITHVRPSELAVKIASTRMNSWPGIIRSDSSVPPGHIDDVGGKSGIWSSA